MDRHRIVNWPIQYQHLLFLRGDFFWVQKVGIYLFNPEVIDCSFSSQSHEEMTQKTLWKLKRKWWCTEMHVAKEHEYFFQMNIIDIFNDLK